MPDIIKKDTPINEAQSILQNHNIHMPYMWEIAIGMLLNDCDYLEVHGYGGTAYFNKITE